ncbi:DUF2357 domain-containing protein [Tropicimonas sp. TH_r6]|uniref:DUF2357 domain-containing protein n=1 Tax=Tropicimonas sp. TH_r6 TaxID=3082085 RepID=UPI0029549F77|nr:DUF2357 domain-containing protein [Tropicimonas sp. TH_r6]MDV7142017.1 DUF2357 domain-containing protein [Tropicimonas sp. TH_r6]
MLGEAKVGEGGQSRYTCLLSRADQELRLFPYPKSGASSSPVQIEGLPARPRIGLDPKDDDEEERRAVDASGRMHRVLARIEEMEGALDDPENLWPRLQEAWDRAEDESDPRMAEIVRQAKQVKQYLLDLERHMRKVLRRIRELTPLDRVQEMDRASMLWMVRQPGRSIAERAGADQRILSIARHENFDTLENRVLHAYLRLASHFARRWLREHRRARHSYRYRDVESYSRLCRRIDRELNELGVGIAEPGVTANYVLLENRSYRVVRESWLRLLRQDKAEDELWAWQAESWTDFCVLALTLALHRMADAKLLAQAPVVWLDEAMQGRRFLHDRPLAVFWLKNSNLLVEVQARPEGISPIQFAAKANVWLRVTELNSDAYERRVPVWTPHSFERMDLGTDAADAASLIEALRSRANIDLMREGLILTQAHGHFEEIERTAGKSRVQAIALDAVGETLGNGTRALASFVRSCFSEANV